MNGKVSLFLVLGFSTLFALFGRSMLNSSNVTVDNYSFYFNRSQAYHIAKSGIYLSLKVFNNDDQNWLDGYSNLSLAGGTLNVMVDSASVTNTIGNTRIITSIGTYNGVTDTVIATLRQRSFSEYGNYYNNFKFPNPDAMHLSDVWAATGDVFDGKFHANDYIRCYGDPEFLGEVTTTQKIKPYDKNSHPIFHETPTEGVPGEIPILDTANIRKSAFLNGKVFYDTTNANRFTDVNLKFLPNGTVDYKSKIGSGSWSATKNAPLTSLTNNGLIYIQGGSVSVEGILKGQVSVVATKHNLIDPRAGQVVIPNSIVYSKDPLLDKDKVSPPFDVDDLLGLVAEKEVIIPFDKFREDISIHASIFAQDGGLKIDKYGSYTKAYNMNLVGGVIGNYVEPTAEYTWSSKLKKYVPVRGYSYVHTYDDRFNYYAPPYFPKRRLYVPELWYSGNVIIPVFG